MSGNTRGGGTTRPLIGGEGLQLSFPTKDVLDDVTLGLAEGQRVGVVGRNGDVISIDARGRRLAALLDELFPERQPE